MLLELPRTLPRRQRPADGRAGTLETWARLQLFLTTSISQLANLFCKVALNKKMVSICIIPSDPLKLQVRTHSRTRMREERRGAPGHSHTSSLVSSGNENDQSANTSSNKNLMPGQPAILTLNPGALPILTLNPGDCCASLVKGSGKSQNLEKPKNAETRLMDEGCPESLRCCSARWPLLGETHYSLNMRAPHGLRITHPFHALSCFLIKVTRCTARTSVMAARSVTSTIKGESRLHDKMDVIDR
ncbi:hypothetical protein C0Q70_09652 [Pomacea canaliculata]|uniref:Uncharacterized protein n=1 Tax=Pomacea canaliculata TaxID=400727 RepID=A0A2T7PAF5_POMCA|nr:hypothetical protein C0Q70_09652 [Pomacea canaliculata]